MMPTIERTTFRTSRLLDFLSEKELIAQTGHQPHEWPLVVLKELLDNALDACEEAGIPPEIDIAVDDDGITVTDNGPGMPHETIKGVLDFTVRTSSREAYADSPIARATSNEGGNEVPDPQEQSRDDPVNPVNPVKTEPPSLWSELGTDDPAGEYAAELRRKATR